ncbi:MAG: sulfite exporter TauE/SafE family protein [Candidatus Omnitrophota bacterium]
MPRIVLSLFLLGLYFGSGPCLASCGPLLVTYIAGKQKGIRKSIFAYLLFSTSRILVYSAFGLAIFWGQSALKQTFPGLARYFYLSGAIFIMFIGLFMVLGKNLQINFCRKFEKFFLEKDAKTIFVFGIIIGILPCPPLVSVISYIGLVAKSWLQSVFLSLAFGLGTLISPLLIIAALAGLIPKFLANNRLLQNIFNLICGLIIIFLGFQLFRRFF